MNLNFKNYLLDITKSSSCDEVEVIQSLWSGYGKISRYQLIGSSLASVVVKFIDLTSANNHPRGWNTDYGHNRKVKSYKVETHWYEEWSQRCGDSCRVPKFMGSFSKGKDQWIVMEDLSIDFPSRKYQLSLPEVKVCLKWLANFHVTFLSEEPKGLWEVGTYWHLATRPHEYNEMKHKALKSKAYEIDKLLNECTYQTIVHGDAKLANFCFSEDGTALAAVDFQYVGGGCGMKDVAYFLGSCLSSSECELYQDELLIYYFSAFQKALGFHSLDFEFALLEEEWRRMYPIACADFTRFLLGWMPSHQKINSYNLKILNSVLSKL